MKLTFNDEFSGSVSGSWTTTGDYICFGQFRLFPDRRVLFSQARTAPDAVHLNSRAMDILIALVRRPGEVVSKRSLMDDVWPDTVVDESNLRVQVAALRRALGDDVAVPRFIEGVSGRGYRFVADFCRGRTGSSMRARSQGPSCMARLPTPITRTVGRNEEMRDLHEIFDGTRLLSVVGPAGIGKTRLALAFGNEIAERFAGGVAFADLSSIKDPDRVAGAVAASLGATETSGDAVELAVDGVDKRPLLILVDCCEHVIDAAAAVVEKMLRSSGRIKVLTTSIEPLRAEGECVYRIGPLELPPVRTDPSLEELLAYSAVELFVDRATAVCGRQSFTDGDATPIADICRRLDGVPLALEIAASRLEPLGLQGLAAELDGSAYLDIQGRRTAKPQHQTLSNLLDWSYGLLSLTERAVLRRLSVFSARFPLAAAQALLDDLDIEAGDSIANLVRKSFLVTDFHDGQPNYRLLGCTRTHAAAKLRAANELDLVRRKLSLYRKTVPDRTGREA